MRIDWDSTFFDLFSPFALLCGGVKVEGAVQARATRGVVAVFAAGGFWLASLSGYTLTEAMNTTGPSNPMLQWATVGKGAWMANYARALVLWIVPAHAGAGRAGHATAPRMAGPDEQRFGHCQHCAERGVSMFPLILPSSVNP